MFFLWWKLVIIKLFKWRINCMRIWVWIMPKLHWARMMVPIVWTHTGLQNQKAKTLIYLANKPKKQELWLSLPWRSHKFIDFGRPQGYKKSWVIREESTNMWNQYSKSDFIPIIIWKLLISKLCDHNSLKRSTYSLKGLSLNQK